MSQKEKSFFAGLEEVFARLLGLALVLTFYLIYIFAREVVTLGWKETLIFLGLFWFVYEAISLMLFAVFKFFAVQKSQSEQESKPKESQLDQDYDQVSNSLNEPENGQGQV